MPLTRDYVCPTEGSTCLVASLCRHVAPGCQVPACDLFVGRTGTTREVTFAAGRVKFLRAWQTCWIANMLGVRAYENQWPEPLRMATSPAGPPAKRPTRAQRDAAKERSRVAKANARRLEEAAQRPGSVEPWSETVLEIMPRERVRPAPLTFTDILEAHQPLTMEPVLEAAASINSVARGRQGPEETRSEFSRRMLSVDHWRQTITVSDEPEPERRARDRRGPVPGPSGRR